MKYYHYSQNNSGGHFDVDDSVDHDVLIQAESPDIADRKAQAIGIYFNGCDTGDDCECCGDRWTPAYGEGTDTPMIYGEPAKEYAKSYFDSAVIIYHADGRKESTREVPEAIEEA